jgi:hypothetical protein
MPRKTRARKHRRSRRRTVRRLRRGGSTSQSLAIPSAAFGPKIGAPVNSTDSWYKIA